MEGNSDNDRNSDNNNDMNSDRNRGIQHTRMPMLMHNIRNMK